MSTKQRVKQQATSRGLKIGITAFIDGFATTGRNGRAESHRYQSLLTPPEQQCLDCDKIQPDRLFQGLGERFLNCAMCRNRGIPPRRVTR